MRITFVLHELPGAGTGRVVTYMANYWAEKGHEVTILTYSFNSSASYPLHRSVRCISLELVCASRFWVEGLFRNIERIYHLRKAILSSNADYVISFICNTNILVLLATRFLSIPVLISERNNPEQAKESRYIWSWQRRLFYPFANHLVVQNEEIKDWFRDYNSSVKVIQNPVKITIKSLEAPLEVPLPSGKLLVAMGFLIKQKGFDMLIEVFSRLRRSGHNWKLIIIGGGPLEKELRRQAKELGIEEVVCFTGHVSNPLNILPKCDLFVLSSRFEGFSNALLEAMACGLPVVSFDCHYSPRELIQHSVNGLLVPEGDLVVLESTLSQLMQDGKMRAELGNEAKKVNQKYAPEKIMKEWEELMNVSSNKI